MKIRILVAALAVFGVGGLIANAQIAPLYTLQVVDLSSVGGGSLDQYNVEGLNDLGHMIVETNGGTLFGYGNYLWDPDGSHAEIPLETVDGLNNNGIVVGHGPKSAIDRGIDDNTMGGAWNYLTNDLREIPTWLDDRADIHGFSGISEESGGVETKIFDINDNNIAMGRTKNGSSPRWQAFVYDYNTSSYYPLQRNGPFDGSGSRQSYPLEGPKTLSENNIAVGYEETRGGQGLGGVVWTDVFGDGTLNGIAFNGTINQLPASDGSFPGQAPAYETNGISINDNDITLVEFEDSGTYGLTNLTTVINSALPQPLGANTNYFDLNNDLMVLGESQNDSATERMLFLWSQTDGVVNLQSALRSDYADWTLDEVFELNDAGQIAAWAIDSLGQERLVLLSPVPEPGSLSLAMVACVSLMGLARRR